MSKLSSAEIDEIVRLREEQRVSTRRIARRIGCSQAAVNYQLLRNGVDPFDRPGSRINQKGGFSADEDARLLQLVRDGVPVHRAAIALGRPKTSALMRLMLLEVRAEARLEGSAP
jgi:hypothetical protein